jgi:hypothetical protein
MPVLHAKTSPGVAPYEGPKRTGHPAAAALQTALILYQQLSCLFVYRIEPPWTDAKARLRLTSVTDFLSNHNMGFLILLKYIDTELRSRVHHILLNIKRSLRT